MNIERIYDICEELKATSGRLDKEVILKREKDNEEWKQFLVYVFDTIDHIYGIQAKKLNKFLGKTSGRSKYDNLFEVFEYLKVHNTADDETVELVAEFIDNAPEKYKQFYIESITKTLKLGIDKSINKAYGNLLPEFNVMLAHPFEKYANKVKGKTLYITEKLDGTRALFIKKDGKVEGFSRQGKRLEGYEHIENELMQLDVNNIVFDGELLVKNADDYKDRDVLQQTLSISSSKGDKSQLNYYLYDVIDVEGFFNGKSKDTYSKRRELLDSLDVSGFNNVDVLPVLYIGEDINYVMELLSQMESEGKEGLMVNLDAHYVNTRSSNILKLKTFMEFDEFCVDVFEGEGKYKGMLGGIILKYKGEYELRCGSGFSDEQRRDYYENPEKIIGKVVTIQYFRESKDKHGNLSVSFPVFIAVTDKTESSYN